MKILQKQQENSGNLDIFTFSFIADLQEEILSSCSTIEKQSQEINELEKQVTWFKQQFQLARQRQFGKSSETSSSMNLSLFDEKMTASGEDVESPVNSETITYTRKKRKNLLAAISMFQDSLRKKRFTI